ncbi:hypothetical protein A6R68_05627 [Neotoma lepida]|uniref:3-ketodihydrosphingosine reductase n=1 Tax=Neotoma lepida TaxID=56216 RepID=A0A1A6GHT5_NEOLE|nr:hypothetical protein A6R68_05627 [Neotoma lepida]
MLLLAAAGLVAFVLLLYMVSPLISPKPLALPGAHVVVTGGSSGIGKCIAIECFKQGAFITLVARNEDKLLQAKKEIEKHSINDKQAQEKLGPVDMLVNCAGMSLSGKFEELEVSTFEVSDRCLLTLSQNDVSSILKQAHQESQLLIYFSTEEMDIRFEI